MNLRQLELVVAVAEEGSFTRAAARCHLVQSALSAQIASLERELGVILFHRTSRAVRLAPAGQILLPHARSLLRGAQLARAEIEAFAGLLTGRLRLGVIGGASSRMSLLDENLHEFHQKYPEVEISIRDSGSHTMVEQLRAGDLDLAFVGLYADQVPAGLHHHLISDEPFVAVVAQTHPLAGRTRVTLPELAGSGSLIELQQGTGARMQVDAVFERAGIDRTVAFEVDSPDAVAHLVSLGIGIALMPEGPARSMPDVSVLDLDDPSARHPVALVHLDPEVCSPSARTFLDLLMGALDT